MVITMNMAIIGINGKMGRQLYYHYKDKFNIYGVDLYNFEGVLTYKHLKEITDKIDVVVDFSSTKAIEELKWALGKKILTLSGTTGYDDKAIDELSSLGGKYFYWTCNYAKGINLFSKLISIIKKEYELFDFIEIHASTKKDAPSGTAKMLAKRLGVSNDTIQSLRLHYAPPIHEIIFSSKNEQITLRHEVTNSNAFIDGFDEKLSWLMKELNLC